MEGGVRTIDWDTDEWKEEFKPLIGILMSGRRSLNHSAVENVGVLSQMVLMEVMQSWRTFLALKETYLCHRRGGSQMVRISQ